MRPHPLEIAMFDKVFTSSGLKTKNCNALILGSTPELRDIIISGSTDDTKLYCVDINKKTLVSMRQGMKSAKALLNKEVSIEHDWLQLTTNKQLSNVKFDYILSEESINMLEKHKWKLLLSQINLKLADNGIAALKIMIKPEYYYSDSEKVRKVNYNAILDQFAANGDYSLLMIRLLKYELIRSEQSYNRGIIDYHNVFHRLKTSGSEKGIWVYNKLVNRFGKKREENVNFQFHCQTLQDVWCCSTYIDQ